MEYNLDSGGNLTATSATITGTIYVTNGTIGGWQINSNSIYSYLTPNHVELNSAEGSIKSSNQYGVYCKLYQGELLCGNSQAKIKITTCLKIRIIIPYISMCRHIMIKKSICHMVVRF